MERKFESDLARRVTGLETGRRSRKTGLVLAAFAVCAMLGTTALYAVAVTEEAGPPLTRIVIWDTERSEYLVENEFAVRHMSLKVQGDHDNANEDSPIQDSMFVYVLEVNTRSVGASIQAGMMLGELTLPTDAGGIDVTFTAKVLDASGSIVTIDEGWSVPTPTTGQTVTVTIPTLKDDAADYGDGYSILISVSIKSVADLGDDLLGETDMVTEIAWGDASTVLGPVPIQAP